VRQGNALVIGFTTRVTDESIGAVQILRYSRLEDHADLVEAKASRAVKWTPDLGQFLKM
jgi:hypothetical protein